MNRKIMMKYKDDILRDIAVLVSIPSIAGPPAPNAPFGEPCARAVNFLLKRAKEMQFEAKNAENAAGHAQYGSGVEIAGVLTHVDVVPAGEGWTLDPFRATLIGRRLYGRGVADSKGAAVAALYCLKAMKDMQLRGTRRLRVIFGSAGEIGMRDMPIYFRNQTRPNIAFTPDSEYGICNREKGLLHLKIKNASPSGRMEFLAGQTLNTVADRATMSIPCNDEEYQAILTLARESCIDITTEMQMGEARLCASGKAQHASAPSSGLNAATYLLQIVAQCTDINRLDPLLTFLHEAIGTQTNGENLTIQCADELSGELTVNVSIVTIASGKSEVSLDIRYPVTFDGTNIMRKVRAVAGNYGLECELLEDRPPLHLQEYFEINRILRRAYKNATGETVKFSASGRATYARIMKGTAVSFGPLFHPVSYHNLHGANEFIDVDEFMDHCEICLEAMIQLMGC